MQENVQQTEQSCDHQAERAGSDLHGLAHGHAAVNGRPHRVQHAGRQTLRARLRQLSRPAGLGHGHRYQSDLQPAAHVRGRERG